VIRSIINRYFDGDKVTLNGDVKKAIAQSDRLYIIAAGTSMNAGYIGRELFEKMANIPCEVHIASEFAYNMPLLSEKPLIILFRKVGKQPT
jgi:glucosamine--fructose-6-phosphate aminotransferase (isomerizing)